jgi:hypothetical protein
MLRILVIDDDSMLRATVRCMLEAVRLVPGDTEPGRPGFTRE